MREITTHKVNELNEALDLFATDEPGSGGANHQYYMSVGREPWVAPGDSPIVSQAISFQNGPIKEAGINGISNEALLAVVQDRLEGFQSGQFACDTNQIALNYVVAAMQALHSRTKERMNRGVEGTLQK